MASAIVEPEPPLKAILPAEIKMKILRSMLICPSKLAFCQLPCYGKEREVRQFKYPRNGWARYFHFSKVLRLALLNQCQDNEPQAIALMADFSALSLTSKNIRLMAREIFLSENQWVLHTSSSFDAVQWVAKYWGLEALGLMRNVRIEIQSVDKMCFDALETFVAAACQGGNLQNLSVRWLAHARSLQYASFLGRTWHFHPISRGLKSERNRKRGRGPVKTARKSKKAKFSATAAHESDDDDDDENDDDESDEDPQEPEPVKLQPEPTRWLKDDVVLLPLKDLRGLHDARIEGTVREAWAVWLERCMITPKGEPVPDFEFEEVGLQAIDNLRRPVEDSAS